MTEAQRDLARRLVEHPRWEWRGGMAQVQYDDAGVLRGRHVVDGVWYTDIRRAGWSPWLPDLADGATAGVLLAMLWDVHCAATVRRWDYDRPGRVEVYPDDLRQEELVYCGDTLGDACAKALFAAWVQP